MASGDNAAGGEGSEATARALVGEASEVVEGVGATRAIEAAAAAGAGAISAEGCTERDEPGVAGTEAGTGRQLECTTTAAPSVDGDVVGVTSNDRGSAW
jgi:hypothetical protein